MFSFLIDLLLKGRFGRAFSFLKEKGLKIA